MSIYTIQTSFASGELSPSLYGRPDLQKYSSGLSRCENFIIHPHGGVSKRPGMRFIAKAKGKCRLVEFEYSIDQTYVLEFGNKYVRFFRDGEQIVSGSSPYEVSTPYAEADLDGLAFTQSADVLYIVHKSYRPMELYRISDANWVLEDFDFFGGPFRTKTAEQADVTLALSATSGSNVRMTASAAVFEAGHVGALFAITHHVDEVIKTSSGNSWTLEVTAYGDWRLESGGFWGGEVVLEYWDEDENAWVKYKTYTSQAYPEGTDSSCGNAKNYSDQDSVDEPTKLRLRTVSFTTFVPDGNAEEDRGYFQLVAMSAYHKAIARVTSVTSSTVAVVDMETEAASTRATVNWQEGSWSDVLGWPSAVGFYQERLAMAATREEPQTWWFSATGDYYDFGTSLEVLDDEAISGTLVSRKLYDIEYFVASNNLVILTSGGEWLLSSGAAGGAVTPSNVDVTLQGNRGCARIEPAVIGNMVLFVQSRALRIRDLGYEYASDSYTGTDLTLLARHLFEGKSIVDWAYAQEPDSMCWTVMSDGSLIALTYIRDQEVYAWARFPTDGEVESVAAVVSGGADDVYLCVKRNGERFIEMFSPTEVSAVEESFFVDSGVTARFDSPSDVVSGLSHLEGREVVCLADGFVIEGLTVKDGKVTLPRPFSLVHVGLPYAALVETLELSYDRQDGTQLTRKSRVASVTARVERTRGLFVGAEVSQSSPHDLSQKEGLTAVEEELLSEAPQRTDENYDEAVGLYTQDYKLFLSSGYGSGKVTCYAPYPLPCSILALVAEVETVQ